MQCSKKCAKMFPTYLTQGNKNNRVSSWPQRYCGGCVTRVQAPEVTRAGVFKHADDFTHRNTCNIITQQKDSGAYRFCYIRQDMQFSFNTKNCCVQKKEYVGGGEHLNFYVQWFLKNNENKMHIYRETWQAACHSDARLSAVSGCLTESLPKVFAIKKETSAETDDFNRSNQ